MARLPAPQQSRSNRSHIAPRERQGKTLAILAASASYIAVPAAMRLALPHADSGLYLTLSLAVTFPFNIIFGIPFYSWLATQLTAG